MRTQLTIGAALLLASLAVQAGGGTSESGMDAQAAFARLKTLQGEWQAQTGRGKAHLSYEVIAGGTSLVERDTADTMPGMLTVYHLDGNRLILQHYCMAGNQPRMLGKSYDAGTGEVRFEFLDASNLTAKGQGHMHNATFRIVGDKLTSAWEFYENGKPKFTENVEYTRVQRDGK